MFLGWGVIKTPFLLLVERFVLPEDRKIFWRLASHRHARFLLKLARINLHLSSHAAKLIKKHKHHAIFVSNHPSLLDGFIIFSVIGPEMVALVEPTEMMTFPASLWFKKAGAVDVIRDGYDSHYATHAHGKQDAVNTLVEQLNTVGKNVLIFPEGHVQRTHRMHYFHTGAARVSIRSGVPIIALGLVNSQDFSLRKWGWQEKNVYIRAAGPIYPKKVTRTSFRDEVRDMTEKLQGTIIDLLPARNVPLERNAKNPEKIGVFIDIDLTVYLGNVQQDFVLWLTKKGKISKKVPLYISYLLIREKLGLIKHQNMMGKIMRFTQGWSGKRIKRYARDFFEDTVVPRMEHHILPIIKDHQKRKHSIFFVTEIVEPLAAEFARHFNARDYRATKLETRKGAYTGNISWLCRGVSKAQAITELTEKYNIDLDRSFAYTDSSSDLPMLELVKHKVVVNPENRLKHQALLHNWNMLY